MSKLWFVRCGGLILLIVFPASAGAGASQAAAQHRAGHTSRADLADLLPPAHQMAVALNSVIRLSWTPVMSNLTEFDHYAVYRSTSHFSSVTGMSPIAAFYDNQVNTLIDTAVLNGVSYYYAVTSVAVGGEEITDVECIGPRTPRDETDLQVVTISRTPRYPRYDPAYRGYSIPEPSGFGPYMFSAAIGLQSGQTGETQRWPEIDDILTFTATIRNRGTNTWMGEITGTWQLDDFAPSLFALTAMLDPGEIVTLVFLTNWDDELHEITFSLDDVDGRSDNNSLTVGTKSVPFLSYVDRSYVEDFRELTAQFPVAQTDDFIDWLNRHMRRFNEMFDEAGSLKRVHYDVLEVIDDEDYDPTIDRQPFAIFPFRFHAGELDLRIGSYGYRPDDDIDYCLIHEMAHQLGIIDLYQLNMHADWNEVSALAYDAPDGLMCACAPFLSRYSAMAMNHWLHTAHGYYGQYMYQIPAEIRLRILGVDGEPLEGATVKVYQMTERRLLGKLITDQVKAELMTDADGECVLPNVAIDPGIVPPTYAGDVLPDNPFGYLAVVGTNGLLHFRVDYGGGTDYAWLDITEVNIAYWEGQTDVAVFERQLDLGGEPQFVPPVDLAELNAGDWSSGAWRSDSEGTYLADELTRLVVGDGSIMLVTDSCGDAYIRYPRSYTGFWNLSRASTLQISFYAENPNPGFQLGSPWIRLRGAGNAYFEYQYFHNGGALDLLNEARDTWRSYEIPLDASPSEDNGWRRTVVGTPDLSDIRSLEIHADTWDCGFTLWVDGVSFQPQPYCRGDANDDTHMDLIDFAELQRCFSGDATCAPDTCEVFDWDHDSGISLSDYQQYGQAITGPGWPMTACE